CVVATLRAATYTLSLHDALPISQASFTPSLAVAQLRQGVVMVGIPGYETLGLFRTTSSTLLYHAVRQSDGLPVIVKTPSAEHPGPRQRARYQREYSLLQRLQGTPGVLRVHGLEVIKDRPLLLLDDVEGRPLSDQLEQPMDASRFLEIVLPLVATVAGV